MAIKNKSLGHNTRKSMSEVQSALFEKQTKISYGNKYYDYYHGKKYDCSEAD